MDENLKQFILYTAPSGEVRVDVLLENESVWLSQKAMAELFGVQVPAISKHFKNIFDEGELVESSVVSKMETTASDDKNYITIISTRFTLFYTRSFERLDQ